MIFSPMMKILMAIYFFNFFGVTSFSIHVPLWRSTLEVYTTETLEKGEETLRHNAAIMQVLEQNSTTVYLLTSMRQEYISTTEYDSEKSWNFPKNHTHAHMFSGILAKGVTRGYNTKVNEGMHGPLKDSYQLHLNFHDFEEQVLLKVFIDKHKSLYSFNK